MTSTKSGMKEHHDRKKMGNKGVTITKPCGEMMAKRKAAWEGTPSQEHEGRAGPKKHGSRTPKKSGDPGTRS